MPLPSPALTQYLTLVANTVTTVNLPAPASNNVIVSNRDGAAEAFFTVDGTNPTVAGSNTYHLPALVGAFVKVPTSSANGSTMQVRAISAGTPQLSIDPSALDRASGSAAQYITPLVTSLNAVTGTATGTALDTINGRAEATMVVVLSSAVAPTSISTQLQGSLDNVTWFPIGAALVDPTSGIFTVSSATIVSRYFRAVTTIAGGTTVTLTAKILCVP